MLHHGQNRFWRKAILGLLAGLSLVPICMLAASVGSAAPQASPGDLIAAVNQLRKANNLPPYQVNPALMAAAQAHSEYQASIGQFTHTGAGGTSPTDRAVAAGYGGGANVYVTENIAGGSSMTVQGAVQLWQGDSLHLSALISASYQDAGAGIASAGGVTYYTLVVGYVAGGPNVASTPGDSTAKPVDASPGAAVGFFPIVISTPGPDGSITHIVQQGQTLWAIAATYGIELEEILRINNLPGGAWIFPGDELLIKEAEPTQAGMDITTESTIQSVEEGTATPTATPRPKRTITPTVDSPAEEILDAPAVKKPGLGIDLTRLPATAPLLIIAALILGGLILIVLGNALGRKE